MQNRLTAFYSFLCSLLIHISLFIIVQLSFDPQTLPNTKKLLLLFFISLVISAVILFFFSTFIIRFQIKKNISKMYNLIPDLQRKRGLATDVEELSEQITSFTYDKTKEIDTLNERENYRREFLGDISHELKTPLFSIQGYLLTLIEGGMEDNSIRDKYLSRINKSVERLIYIAKDLDLISELERGNIVLEKKPFNISALVQEVFDLLERKAENNHITLKLDKPYPLPVRVIGDIERIQQILINLVVNAINYSDPHSEVIVSFVTTANKTKIAIKDNGRGIQPEYIDRIFERFYRIDKSRDRNQGGSGLGLAIVKHILDAHNEKVFVQSTFGKGTEFYFYLNKA